MSYERTPRERAAYNAACWHVTDDLEVDEPRSAEDFSHCDVGTWVRAWVYVCNDDIEEELV